MNITQAAIERNRVTLVVIFFVVLAGFLAYNTLPRSEDPGFPIRNAMVLTHFPGASPERVEELVSDKIEEAIQEMPELDNVVSKNKTGVSAITVTIKSQYKQEDLRKVWDSLRRKVDSVRDELPDGIIGPTVNDEFGDVFGIVIGVTGEGYDYAELEEVAEEVRDELLRLDDIAKVEIFGTQDERVFIEFKNERLSELGLSPGQLQQTLEAENIVIPGGQVRYDAERYALEPTGNYESVEAIENSLIKLPGRNDVVPLQDVVTVKRGYIDPPSSVFHDTGVPGLALALSMREGGNIIGLGDEATAKIRELEERYPIGLEFNVLIFQPKDVAKIVDDFSVNVLQAVGIVMFAMILVLGFRTGIVVASLIPTAIAAALLVMNLFGIGLDQMSLASLIIALGMLVDNAVVMAESTMVQMSEGKKPVRAAVDSATELRVPLLVSSLTTCAAFLPIYLAESETGEYTAPLFKVVTITLLCSWLLAITMTPALCARFLKVQKQEGSFDSRFYRAYRGGLLGVLRRPIITLAGVFVVFMLAMQGLGRVPQLFFPPSDNPSFSAELELPTGTAIEHTRDVTKKLERYIEQKYSTKNGKDQGVTHWATFIGEGGPRYYLSYAPEPPTSDFAIILASATDRETVEKAVADVQNFITEELPDVRATVRPRALGPSTKAPVMFKVSGRDNDTLFTIVEEAMAKLESIPGTQNIRHDWGARTKKLKVLIDQTRARRAGLSNQDIAVSLQTALSGFEVTEYREGNEIIPVVMRSVEADRGDVGKIEDLSVFAQATGQSVPLKQVADVEVVWQPSQIFRKDRLRTVTILSNLEPGVTAVSVNAVMRPWFAEAKETWDVGYRWEMDGEAKDSEKANKSIGDKLPIAGLIIVMLLVWQFNSIRRSAIILMTIPLAMIGVTIGLLGASSYFGFMTLLGIISLAGIVINNAIVLIDRIKIEIEQNGFEPNRAIIEAAQRRLRPILLTTFTTILGLLPLWLAGGPMWEPMAIAIIFGLLFSTMLTLGVVPILYSLFFRVKFKGFEFPAKAG